MSVLTDHANQRESQLFNQDPVYCAVRHDRLESYYRYDNCSYHLSYLDDAGYQELGQHADDGKATIPIGWLSDYAKLPVIRRFTFAPHVNPRNDKMPVELIGIADELEVSPQQDRETRHAVKLTRPFAVLDREITWKELIAFKPKYGNAMQQSNSQPAAAGSGTDRYDSVGFCRWLSGSGS